MDKKQIAFCGYRCDLCPAFLGNLDRLADRTTLRRAWCRFFGFDISEERIICVGCAGIGNHLDMACPVRPCALRKQLQDCSSCEIFESCSILRLRADILVQVKKNYHGTISEEEYQLFFRPYEGRDELTKQKKKRNSHGI